MTYESVIQFLYEQLPMFQRQGKSAFKKSLDNIYALLEKLDNPHHKFKNIHIAGTNGKGTTTHMIAGVLQAHGYKTGIYSSPHYKDFRERIKINGVFIDKQSVIDFVSDNMELIDYIRPSFFELTVAMSFYYFAEQKIDIAVIETGLGGRLDSTNVILPLLSVITNISLDHQSILGNTLQEIALEKAGIIKYHTPVIIGEYQEGVSEVFEKQALEKESNISYASLKSSLKGDVDISFYMGEFKKYDKLSLKVDTIVQRKNLTTALYTISQLEKILDLESEKIVSGINDFYNLTYYIGRYQSLGESPTILADSAHNKSGIKALFKEINKQDYQNIHIVLGFVNDKDVTSVLSLFPKKATYYFCKAGIPRGLPVEDLQKKASEHGLYGHPYQSVNLAYRKAKVEAEEEDLILVCGSIFVVAEVI